MDTFNIPDIIAELEFCNTSIQCQGFTSLLSLLKSTGSIIPKERESLWSLYYDCSYKYGEAVKSWFLCSVLDMLEKGVYSKDEIVQECALRISSSTDSTTCLRTIFDISKGDIARESLHLIRKHALGHSVCSYVLKLPPQQLSSECILPILLFCTEVEFADKFGILKHLSIKSARTSRAIEKKLNTLPTPNKEEWKVYRRELFKIASNLVANPKLVLNSDDDIYHHVLLPQLLSLVSCWEKVGAAQDVLTAVGKCKLILPKCMKIAGRKMATEISHPEEDMTTFEYMEMLLHANIDGVFLNMWLKSLENKVSALVKDETMLFAAALLPYCIGDHIGRCFELLAKVVAINPALANTMLPLFLMLYTKPYFAVEKEIILKAIRELVTTRFVVVPIVKFFCVLAQQNTKDRFIAMKYLGELVVEYPTIFDYLVPLVNIGEADSTGVVTAKFDLMTIMFSASDGSDDLLPMLSKLLKSEGHILSEAINVVANLCADEVLDLALVRKQLSFKVHQEGNTEALMSYCRLRAVSAKLIGEDDSSNELMKELRMECISELWKIKDLNTNVSNVMFDKLRCRAWSCLGSFSFDDITEATGMDPENLVLEANRLHSDCFSGYQDFIHSMLTYDIETLSRTIYTKQYERDNFSVANSTYSWFDSLGRTNAESPWLWCATLPMFSYILNSTPVSKRHVFGLKMFRRLLCEVPLSTKSTATYYVRLLAGWRAAASEMLRVLAASKNDDWIWARDQLAEECGRALRHTEMSIHSVLIALCALATEMISISEKMPSDKRRVLDVAMKPWLISVFEFNLPITDSGNPLYAQKHTPLFQINVNPSEGVRDVARFCDFVLYRIATRFDITALGMRSFNVLSNTNPFESDDATLSLLSGDIPTGSLCRDQMWIVGVAFDLNPLILSSFGDSHILTDVADTDTFNLLLNKENGDTTLHDVEAMMSLACNLPAEYVLTCETKMRRRLERLWSNSNDFKRIVFEVLDQLSVSQPTWTADRLNTFLAAMISLKRSDDRTLPPMNWARFLLPIVNSNNDIRTWLILLKIACQEGDCKLLYICKNTLDRSDLPFDKLEMATVLWKWLPTVLQCLPSSDQCSTLEWLFIRVDEYPALADIALQTLPKCINNMAVQTVIISRLPNFDNFGSDVITSWLLKMDCIDSRFQGRVSVGFDFWLECHSGSSVCFETVLSLFNSSSDDMRDSLLRIFGHSQLGSSENEILARVFDLISVHNIADKSGNYEATSSLFFLALICALPAPVPMCWVNSVNSGVGIISLMNSRWYYYWETYIGSKNVERAASAIRRFLLSHLKLSINAQMSVVIRDMLLLIMANYFMTASEFLEEPMDVWKKLFSGVF